MLHLFNNQVGADPKTLGFPSVDSCNAIVYQTDQGLCGLHNYGGDSPHQYDPRAIAFTQFVQNQHSRHPLSARRLVSVINKRYDARKGDNRKLWVDEMRAFAKKLGFTGNVELIALVKHLYGEPAYIQFDVDDGPEGYRVRYKRYTKMTSTKTDAAPSGLRELRKDMDAWNTSLGALLRYEVAKPGDFSEVIDSVAFSRSGESFHRATGGADGGNSLRFSFKAG